MNTEKNDTTEAGSDCSSASCSLRNATDKEVLLRAMEILETKPKACDEVSCLFDIEEDCQSEKITSQGYDYIEIGFMFNKDDSLKHGFVDSHVAFSSKNRNIIRNHLGLI